MTVQVLTNGDPELAAQDRPRHGADDLAPARGAARRRPRSTPFREGVALAKEAVAARRDAGRAGRPQRPLRLRHLAAARDHRAGSLEHPDRHHRRRRGHAPAQGARRQGRRRVRHGGRRLVDESAGEPVRVTGTILQRPSKAMASSGVIQFGRGNVLVLSTYLVQIMEPLALRNLGLDLGAFDIIAIKSRVHFRRGFHDNGFARTILLVEPPEPFLGTVHLDKLPYRECRFEAVLPVWKPDISGVMRRVADRRPHSVTTVESTARSESSRVDPIPAWRASASADCHRSITRAPRDGRRVR